jgi:hypothetical protein
MRTRETVVTLVRRIVSCVGVAVLAACGSTPPPPDWEVDARAALDAYARDALRGRTALADRDLARAIDAVSSTGRPGLVALVQLTRCAIERAALAFDACPDPVATGRDGGAEEHAYAQFLSGHWSGLAPRDLPETYRAVVAAKDDSARLAALRGIDDRVSRLVACGALMGATRLPPDGMDIAIDAASEGGLRRALLAWLGARERAASLAGDTAAVSRIRARIAVAGGTPTTR